MQISRYLALLTFVFAPLVAVGQSPARLSDRQAAALLSCVTETDNLRRLLCYDLGMGGQDLEEMIVSSPLSNPLRITDYQPPSLAPILRLLEGNRKLGEASWQFAISGEREGEFVLLNVLYGPSKAFGHLSSIYWPQPSAILQTGIDVFASQKGQLNPDAFLLASCQQAFPSLRLALDRPLPNETYQVDEVYPDGTRRQGIWRTVDDGLVLEMARGDPAFQAMAYMSVDGIVNFSLRDGQGLRVFEFSTRNFADIATSIALSCNAEVVQQSLEVPLDAVSIPQRRPNLQLLQPNSSD